MLVLTRKRHETIKIGSDIVIRVIKTSTGSVKIGIDAPSFVRVLRGELATVQGADVSAAEGYSVEEGCSAQFELSGNDEEVVNEDSLQEEMLVLS